MAFVQLDDAGHVVGLFTIPQNPPTPPGYTTIDDDDPRIATYIAARDNLFKPRPTPLQWLRRLTLDKQQAIFAAAATNPLVLGWLFEADGVGGGIDVTDPLTIQGVTAIAAVVPTITADAQALLLAP
jgi:hypothetical protein